MLLELDAVGVEAPDVPLEPAAGEDRLCAGRFLCAAGFSLGGWDAFAVVVVAAAVLMVVTGGNATGTT